MYESTWSKTEHFSFQPAWQTGLIQAGDILLKADSRELTGLSLRQALDVLRCSPPTTTLIVCRPQSDYYVDRPENEGDIAQDFNRDETMSPSKFFSRVLRSYSYTPATR